MTEVHLTIITSAKPETQIGDVPVIDGFRGIDKDPNERPIFRPIMMPNPVYSYLRRDNIPQVTKFILLCNTHTYTHTYNAILRITINANN